MPKRLMAALLAVVFACAALPSVAFARDQLKNTDPERYYVELNTANQVVTVYEKDDDGEYTRIVRRMVCTSGRTEVDPNDPEDHATPTPSGKWKAGARERFGKFAAFSGEYARYWTQVVGGIYFHSIMFSSRDIETLKRSPFNTLGRTGSHGCIRLYVEDAKWMYYHICPGTTINIVSRSGNAGLTSKLKTDMTFYEYDSFQQNIFDEEPLENLRAWVIAEKVAMRTGNGTNDRFITNLYRGTEVEVLQEGDPWMKVLVDGREGYLKRAYMTYQKGVMESTPNGVVAESTIYLYSKPSTKSSRLYKIARDSSLAVLPQEFHTDGWLKVNYWGTIGFVQERSVKKDWAMVYDWAEAGQ